MHFDVITIFPKIFGAYFRESILKRAEDRGVIAFGIYNPRDYTADASRRVDERAYGGGPGMVIRAEPIAKAIGSALKDKKFKDLKRTKIILLSAGGRQFTAKMAAGWAKKYDRLIMIAGRYEGVDARIKKIYKMEEVSVGPYVVTGGELPALIVIDAVARHVSGVLGKRESLEENRLGIGVPVYTRPEALVWEGKKYRVPKVLLSGDHKKIALWRKAKIVKK